MHHPCIDLPNKHSFAMETVHSATHALTMDKPSIFKNIGKKIKKTKQNMHNHAMAMYYPCIPCIGHALSMRFFALGSGEVVKKWSLLTFLIGV